MEATDRDFPPVRPLSAYPNRILLSDIPLQRLTQKGRLTPPDTAAIADIVEVSSGTSAGSLICLLREHGALLCIHNTVSESFDAEEDDLCMKFPGARIAIKDGFITGKPKGKGGKPVIHVACPASINFIGLSEDCENSPRLQNLLRSLNGNRFEALKKLGEDLTAARQYVLAGICLDAALTSVQPGVDAASTSAQPGLADVYAERAKCYHMLLQFPQAIRSCDQALSIDERCAAALHIKGIALSEVKRHGEALATLQTAKDLDLATKPKIQATLERVMEDISKYKKQRENGEYDVINYFLKNFEEFKDVKVDKDYCGYTSEALEIKLTSGTDGRGRRGVFLTRDVEAGDLLMVYGSEVMGPSVQAIQVRALTECSVSSRSRRVLKLLPDPDESGEVLSVPRIQDFDYNVEEEDDGVIDVQRIKRVVELASSRLSLPDFPQRKQVFALPSFIKHSCLPNSSVQTIDPNLLFVRAATSIKAGGEITFSYIDCLQPLAYRSRELGSRGMKCSCERCEVEKRYRKVLSDVPHVILWPEMEEAIPAAVSMVERLERALGKVSSMSDEERGMIRAGYGEAYMMVAGKVQNFESLTKLELVYLLRKFVPGHEKSIALVCLVALEYVCKLVWEERLEQAVGDAMAAMIGKVDLPSGDYLLICNELRHLVVLADDGQ